ncbi:hypothetical protein [Corynebacterium sp.]|uniref:hypothetical protein n=1 Tax=Corynebacterium sp. TaxID=1720 RepID=UPI0026DCFF42|nr:hypothetical protein [Corynebacterium sp.]MDO5031562.1 hypothetical protein [Corynebacterium sp.]
MPQPLRLPRSELRPLSETSNTLTPTKDSSYYHSANPHPDLSGSHQVIESTGPAPGARVSLLSTFVYFFFLIFGVFFALMGGVFSWFTGGFSDFDWHGLFFVGLGLLFAFIGGFLLIRQSKERTRLAAAWRNGWISFYPALVGEIYLHRTYTTSSDNGDTTHYMYKAPLLVLFPDGSMNRMHSYEFQLNRRPAWYRKRGFNMAAGPDSAFVDFNDNNGWAIVGINHALNEPRAELSTGLKRDQQEALFAFAEQNWVPQQ